MVQKLLNLKQKILKLFQLNSTSFNLFQKTGLNGYVYDFSLDYDYLSTSNILDIHKHFMKKNDTVRV